MESELTSRDFSADLNKGVNRVRGLGKGWNEPRGMSFRATL